MTKWDAIDWVAVEADYRAGRLTNVEIARKHGCSESAVRKHAAEGRWTRAEAPGRSTVPQTVIIPPVGQHQVNEDGSVRTAPQIGQALALRMLDELDGMTMRVGEMEALIAEETSGEGGSRRRELLIKVVSLPARAATLKTLAQALSALAEAGKGAGGVKEQRKEAAKAAATGKFAPPAPPKLVVSN